MNRTKRADWKSAATQAGAAAISDRLRVVTAVWAAARHDYLTLWDADMPDVRELREAARRFEDLDRMRRALASKLDVAA
jgi:hypothetical protein